LDGFYRDTIIGNRQVVIFFLFLPLNLSQMSTVGAPIKPHQSVLSARAAAAAAGAETSDVRRLTDVDSNYKLTRPAGCIALYASRTPTRSRRIIIIIIIRSIIIHQKRLSTGEPNF